MAASEAVQMRYALRLSPGVRVYLYSRGQRRPAIDALNMLCERGYKPLADRMATVAEDHPRHLHLQLHEAVLAIEALQYIDGEAGGRDSHELHALVYLLHPLDMPRRASFWWSALAVIARHMQEAGTPIVELADPEHVDWVHSVCAYVRDVLASAAHAPGE